MIFRFNLLQSKMEEQQQVAEAPIQLPQLLNDLRQHSTNILSQLEDFWNTIFSTSCGIRRWLFEGEAII